MDNDTLIFASDVAPAVVNRMLRRGEIQRVASGVYVRASDEPVPQSVKRLWPQVAGHLFPNAVITDRSARTGGPIGGVLYLAHARRGDRTVVLPGIVVTARHGAPPEPDDVPLPGGLRLASRGRGLAENARESRARSKLGRRTLGDDELADWIDDLARVDGTDRLLDYRARAEDLAGRVGASDRKMILLRQAVGAAVGTQHVRTRSRSLDACQSGHPFDRARIQRFEILADALLRASPQYEPLVLDDPGRYRFEPFFEAYFSNYIEGTEFTLEEAQAIVFDGRVPSERSADGHDLTGTYRLLADADEMRRTTTSAAGFVEVMRHRNSVIMAGRPEKRPGLFKEYANRAGQTQFVDPDLVDGTLREAFPLLGRLDTGWQRAVLATFVTAEVHPFADGNGRTARVMMNAELEACGQSRIIIVNVFRTDYLDGLRALSRRDDPSILISAMRTAHSFTASVDFRDFDAARQQLQAAHAFDEVG